MMYILTEEEFKELNEKKQKITEDAQKILQEFCTRVANEMPIYFFGNDKKYTWGCILTKEEEWYCDKCPSLKVCPYNRKRYSK